MCSWRWRVALRLLECGRHLTAYDVGLEEKVSTAR